jgi:hypothetical protein
MTKAECPELLSLGYKIERRLFSNALKRISVQKVTSLILASEQMFFKTLLWRRLH